MIHKVATKSKRGFQRRRRCEYNSSRYSSSSRAKNVKQLEIDIRNSVFHVFGFHDNGSEFCKKKTVETTATQPSNQPSRDDYVDGDDDDDTTIGIDDLDTISVQLLGI